jgi:hypothetical protein
VGIADGLDRERPGHPPKDQPGFRKNPAFPKQPEALQSDALVCILTGGGKTKHARRRGVFQAWIFLVPGDCGLEFRA